MLCCLSSDRKIISVNLQLKKKTQDFHNAKITAIALALIAIFLVGVGYILLGIGTLPATSSIAFEFMPKFIAPHFIFIGTGLFISAIAFVVLLVYRHMQMKQLQEKL